MRRCDLRSANGSLAQIRQNGSVKQFFVDDKPFIMLSGELHNSSPSSIEYMRPIWDKLSALHLNTVIGAVSWELVEPKEGKFDFSRLGLMGHSRGGDCVIAMAERITLPGVTIKAVLSLAPVNSGANSGKPHGYAFMTFLPAADGDVVDNNGAQFYDQAKPDPLKVQLYIDFANHDFFNRQWPDDPLVTSWSPSPVVR